MDSIFSTGKRIVIVEDEEIVTMSLEETLSSVGYEIVEVFSSGEEALSAIPDLHPDLVLMDIRLDGSIDGVEAARHLLSGHDIPVVYLTAYSGDELMRRVLHTAPYGYIIKPYRDRELFCAIEVALARHRLERALRESEQRYRALFRNASDIIFLNMDGGDGRPGPFIEANDAALDKLGYTKDELVALSLHDIYDENCHDDVERMLRELQEMDEATVELIIVAKSGRKRLVEVNAHRFPINDGVVVLSICRDIDL